MNYAGDTREVVLPGTSVAAKPSFHWVQIMRTILTNTNLKSVYAFSAMLGVIGADY